MTKRFLPDISIPSIDSIIDSGKDLFDKGVDIITGGDNPASPDFSKFMNKVGAEDLSRPNLFLVRFSNFATHIKADGVMDFLPDLGGPNPGGSSLERLSDWGIDQIREFGVGMAMNSEIGKKLMGAYNPKLLRTILPGEFLDGIIPMGFDINKDIAMLVKAASIPGTGFDTGRNYADKKPMTTVTGRSVDNITLTFYLRTNHMERAAMHAWMNMVQDPTTNEFGFYDTYAREIEIYPLDRSGVPMSVTKLDGCFPVSLSPINYDTDSNNMVATFDVEFTVSTMVTKEFNGSSPFFNEARSIWENVKTNPALGKLF